MLDSKPQMECSLNHKKMMSVTTLEIKVDAFKAALFNEEVRKVERLKD